MMSGKNKTKLAPSVDLGYPTEPYGRIPAFNNVEEEAEFWDTHDTDDFGHDWQPVEVTVIPQIRKERRVTVRFDETEEKEIEQKAQSLGIGASTLIRMWVKERLQKERAAS